MQTTSNLTQTSSGNFSISSQFSQHYRLTFGDTPSSLDAHDTRIRAFFSPASIVLPVYYTCQILSPCTPYYILSYVTVMQNPPVHIYIFKPLSGTPGKPRTSDSNYTQPTVPLIPRQCVALATFPLLLAGISFILITTPLHNGSWDSTMSYSYLNLLPLNDDVGYRCHFIHSWISSRPAHVHSHTTTP